MSRFKEGDKVVLITDTYIVGRRKYKYKTPKFVSLVFHSSGVSENVGYVFEHSTGKADTVRVSDLVSEEIFNSPLYQELL